MRNTLLILCFGFFIFYSEQTFAQAAGRGAINGKVTDFETEEGLPSANIRIEGQPFGTNSDLDGNFLITGIPVGTYNIIISYLGYKNDTLRNVLVKKDQVTQVAHKLVPEGAKLGAVEIIAERTVTTSTEMSLISEMRNSVSIASGISSQMISRSNDRDASEVVKRVPGITIFGDKFIVVRGLPARYSTVFLNDVLTPSSEPDKRAFSFDMVPSSLMDRLLVFKSPSPDLPGDFAGGAIKLYTKNTADARQFSFNLSIGHRPGSTFINDFQRTQGSNTDWLGFDGGARQLPTGVPDNFLTTPVSSTENARLSQSFRNEWAPTQTSVGPDFKLGFNYYDSWKLGNKKLRNLTSITYSRSYERYFIDRSEKLIDGSTYLESNDQQSTQNTRVGILQNFTLVLNERNRLELRNFLNQMGMDEATTRFGFNQNSPGLGYSLLSYSLYYQSRTLYSGQLSGVHFINNKNTIEWFVGYGLTYRQEPDWRRMLLRKLGNSFSLNESDYLIFVTNSGSLNPDYNTRFFSNLTENGGQGGLSYEYKAESGFSVKVGTFNDFKYRDFKARLYSFVRNTSSIFGNDVPLSSSQIFSSGNFRTDGSGFILQNSPNPTDEYFAYNLLNAGYVHVNYPTLNDKILLNGGLRVEYNRQYLQSPAPVASQPAQVVDKPFLSFLPSLNLTYRFTEKTSLRAGYGITVNRPELRELAPFSIYLFDWSRSQFGNPNLVTCTIHNAEARFEFYPELNEILTIGGFYKYFVNPIEQTIAISTQYNFTFQNATSAYSTGIEAEVRKGLDFISPKLRNVSVMFNGALIYSRVSLAEKGQVTNRPMQGQSPYVVNAGLFYNNEESGWQINVLYNVFGPRIFAVGLERNATSAGAPSYVELPRNVLDLTVAKTFGLKKNFEIKAGVTDILNQPFRIFQDFNSNLNFDDNEDNMFIRYRPGAYYSLTFIYKF